MKSKVLVLLSMALLTGSALQAQTTDVPLPAATPTSSASEASTQVAAKPPRAPPGFKLAKRADGETMYCQQFSRVGTRFTEKVCFTQEQYEEFERRNQKMRESMQRPISCSGLRNCAGAEPTG